MILDYLDIWQGDIKVDTLELPFLLLLYWFLVMLLDKQTNKLTNIYSQAFVSNATSSGEIQTLIDKDIKQGNKLP